MSELPYRLSGGSNDEEDAARTYDAALVKYGLQGDHRYTVNFPGEAPLASVLAALPELYDASVLSRATATAAPRHERSLAARRVPPAAPAAKQTVRRDPCAPKGQKPVEMRRVGDGAWRWFGSHTDAGKAFGVSTADVSHLIKDPTRASKYAQERFEARPAPPRKRKRPAAKKPRFVQRCVDGAKSKSNGKWSSDLFPGREFDDLDEYRAARKQRSARRAEYYAREGKRYHSVPA